MRFTAEEFAERTLALLVGVGTYEKSGPRELAADRDVLHLCRTLIDPAACGIPPKNVTVLANRDATLERVMAELRLLQERSTSESMLLVYLSGHGHRQDDLFIFHLFDTDPEDLTVTGLTASRLTECLHGSPARGVLVIADCCVGAGFAETAPRYFFELGTHEFRLAISASRADEPSWEVPGEGGSLFCRHLADILAGTTAAGIRPGEITYLGLIEGLRFALEEDLALRGESFPRQEIVANGSLASDPPLFVSARGAMKGLTVETGRVTRAYLRRTLIRSAIGVVVSLLVGAGLYSAWLGIHEYAEVDYSGTAVYRGLPGWSGFGYPILLFRLSGNLDTYDPYGRLGRDEQGRRRPPLLVRGTGRILLALESARHPLLRAAWLADTGRRDEARQELNAIRKDGRGRLSPAQDIAMAMLRLRLAPRTWISRLEQAVGRSSNEERRSAMLALLELDSERALRILSADLSQAREPLHDHREALLSLEPPCSSSKIAYLRSLLGSDYLHNVVPHLLLVWRRLKCPVTVEDVRAFASMSDVEEVEHVGTWAKLMGFDRPGEILESSRLDLEHRAAFAVGWGGLPCQEGWFRREELSPQAKALILLHATNACPDLMIETRANRSSLHLILREPSRPEPLVELQIPAPLVAFNLPEAWAFAPTMKLITRLRARESEPFLIEQILRGELHTVATPALRAAHALGISWRPGQGFFRGTNDEEFALEYYFWLRQTSRAEADRIARDRILSSRFPYFFRYAAILDTPLLERADLLALVRNASGPSSMAAARLVAMFGDSGELERLADHPEPAIRSALGTHGPYNPATRAWLKRPRPDAFDLLVYRPGIRRAVDLVATMEQDLGSLDPASRCLILELELEKRDMRGTLGQLEVQPAGVQLWFEREMTECNLTKGP